MPWVKVITETVTLFWILQHTLTDTDTDTCTVSGGSQTHPVQAPAISLVKAVTVSLVLVKHTVIRVHLTLISV